MSRALDDLDPRFRPLAVELIARCVEAGIQIMIIDTLRTPVEHAYNLAKGVSWVKHSKHMDGLAIDLCPYAVWELDGADKLMWDAAHPVWPKMATIARGLGLKCGFDWKVKDCGHYEYVEPHTGAVKV